MHSHRNYLAGILLLGISVSLLLFVSVQKVSSFRYIEVGEKAPILTLKNLQGLEVSLDFPQKVGVVIFWRKGQDFSLQALKDLQAIYGEMKDKGVEIAAIAEPNVSLEEVKAIREKLGLSYSFYLDPTGKAEEEYGVIVFPSTGIIGKDGIFKFYQPSRSAHPDYRQRIAQEVKAVLGGSGESAFMNTDRAEESYRIGLELFNEGKTNEAIQAFRQSIKLDPAYLDAHVQLGNALLEKGDLAQAQREFEFVLKRNLSYPGARTGIGIVYVRKGEIDKGIELLQEAVQLNPNPVKGYHELGMAYEKKGDLEKALHSYKWAMKKLLQGRR